MSIEIFPHSLVRYAGMGYQVFDSFKLEESKGILQKDHRMKDAKARLKTLICDGLFFNYASDRFRQMMSSGSG
ncbi:hypothetical protein [Pedobacter sp. NJ-S-72]